LPLAGRITISLIVAGGYSETLGIPALFDSRYFDALASLPDTAGAKSLIEVPTDAVRIALQRHRPIAKMRQ
jgi:hypothetical protein